MKQICEMTYLNSVTSTTGWLPIC